MNRCRGGEPDKIWFRNDRFFSVEQDWFFATREGVDVGPFPARENAAAGLERYVDSIQADEGSFDVAKKIALQGVWATHQYH